MKSVLVCLMMVMSVFGFTQKIDYENFDNTLATNALKNAYLTFMDTFTYFGRNPKNQIKDIDPQFYSLPETRKIGWSDFLYKNVSFVSCSTLIARNEFDHLNFEPWLDEVKIKFVSDNLKNHPSSPKKFYNTNHVSLTEVLFSCENCRSETYEELAKHMIEVWDKSTMHAATIRCITYNSLYYEDFNEMVVSKFSCNVMYDKKNNKVLSCINLFHF